MGCVVVDAVLQVKEFFNTVLLVVPLSVVRLPLGSGDALHALLEVMLEAMADALGSGSSEGRVGIFGLVFVLVVLFFFFLFLFFSFFDFLGSLLRGFFNGFGLEWVVSKNDRENRVDDEAIEENCTEGDLEHTAEEVGRLSKKVKEGSQ